MGKIQLTPEELLSQSQEMSSLKNQYESLFQSVDGILNDVNNSWSESDPNAPGRGRDHRDKCQNL